MKQEEKIIDRVRKLLALSQSSNANEAALAAAKAQALLQHYNLELSQVQLKENFGPEYIKKITQTKRQIWTKSLLEVLCSYNFCSSVYVLGTGMCSIVGEKHNIEVVEYLHTYLVRELVDMANKAYEETDGRIPKITWKDSFFYGAIHSIRDRLEEQKQRFEQESNQTRSLVVVKDEELEAALRKFYPKVRKAPPKRIYANDGYAKGRESGQRVLLQRAIEK